MQRSILSWALVALLASLLFLKVVMPTRAEEDGDEDLPEDGPKDEADPTKTDDEEVDIEIMKASPDIVTHVHFPEFPDKKFPIGGDVTVLVGITNKGKSDDYNMSYIGASLHNPFDLAYYIQNFTWRVAEGRVEAGSEQTFEYTFRPDSRLEPLGFWLTAFIAYNNTETGVPHRSFFHNSTIELVERPTDMNARRGFTYVLAFAAAGIVGYFAWTMIVPKKSTSAERGTRRDESSKSAADSWVPQAYTQAKKSKVVGRKREKDAPRTPKSPTNASDA